MQLFFSSGARRWRQERWEQSWRKQNASFDATCDCEPFTGRRRQANKPIRCDVTCDSNRLTIQPNRISVTVTHCTHSNNVSEQNDGKTGQITTRLATNNHLLFKQWDIGTISTLLNYFLYKLQKNGCNDPSTHNLGFTELEVKCQILTLPWHKSRLVDTTPLWTMNFNLHFSYQFFIQTTRHGNS